MSYASNAGQDLNPTFDNVFVNPRSYDAFLKSGMWPDQTVLLLEVRGSASRASINRSGRFQTELLAIEAHVKDNARGGWAFYTLGIGGERGSLIPKSADCYSCHEKSGATDTTFVQFYPTLIPVAKAAGTYKAGAE
jgi:hypothetical protein